MPEFIVRLFNIPLLSVAIQPDEVELIEEEEDDDGSARLHASDLSFGFSPDPLFREFYWEEEE